MTARAVFFLALMLSSCQSSYQPPGSDIPWQSVRVGR